VYLFAQLTEKSYVHLRRFCVFTKRGTNEIILELKILDRRVDISDIFFDSGFSVKLHFVQYYLLI